jgi:hypothetical protein
MSEKKCIAIHLPATLMEQIDYARTKTGKSHHNLLIELIEKGLDRSTSQNAVDQQYFLVKVRIDTSKMMEFGQKLQSGAIDTSHTLMTFCLNDDPTVGISFWQADNLESFKKIFAQHKPYYKEIIEIKPVITPMESMKVIMQTMQKV